MPEEVTQTRKKLNISTILIIANLVKMPVVPEEQKWMIMSYICQISLSPLEQVFWFWEGLFFGIS